MVSPHSRSQGIGRATPEGAPSLAQKARAIVGDRLDILVSNAGVSQSATLKDYNVEDFDRLYATNLRSPFFLVRELLPALGPGSSVVFISSLGGRTVVGNPDPRGPGKSRCECKPSSASANPRMSPM